MNPSNPVSDNTLKILKSSFIYSGSKFSLNDPLNRNGTYGIILISLLNFDNSSYEIS